MDSDVAAMVAIQFANSFAPPGYNGSEATGPASAPAAITPPPLTSVSETGADGADAGIENAGNGNGNARKRKKASRACDFCHVNHQPCDNGQPRCSVCAKHDKPCLYLRPTKRRGPQKGYRTALNSYKESAAAWGAVLAAIPGLDALIEGHLLSPAGAAVMRSVKEGSQQDGLIAKWQGSNVYRTLFGSAGIGNGNGNGTENRAGRGRAAGRGREDSSGGGVDGEGDEDGDEVEVDDDVEEVTERPAKRVSTGLSSSSSTGAAATAAVNLTSLPALPPIVGFGGNQPPAPSPLRLSTSLSDIVARDAARSIHNESQILAPLGFAANETLDDFYSLAGNPEPLPKLDELSYDPDMEKIFYELGMGGRFLSG